MDLGTLFEVANMHLRVGYLSLRCANEEKKKWKDMKRKSSRPGNPIG
jgi:hypothetical protein